MVTAVCLERARDGSDTRKAQTGAETHFWTPSSALGCFPSLECSEALLSSYSFLPQSSGRGQCGNTVGPLMARGPPAC